MRAQKKKSRRFLIQNFKKRPYAACFPCWKNVHGCGTPAFVFARALFPLCPLLSNGDTIPPVTLPACFRGPAIPKKERTGFAGRSTGAAAAGRTPRLNKMNWRPLSTLINL